MTSSLDKYLNGKYLINSDQIGVVDFFYLNKDLYQYYILYIWQSLCHYLHG